MFYYLKSKSIIILAIGFILTLANCTNNAANSHYNPTINPDIIYDPNLNYLNYIKLAKTKFYNKLNNWKLKSKIQILNVKNDKKPKGNQFLICYMNWEKINTKSIVKLYSVFNLQSITMEYHNNNINNITHNNNIELDLNNLLNQKLIRINDLNNWLIGIPNFDKPYKAIYNSFIQNGWLVEYSNFKSYKYEFNANLPTRSQLLVNPPSLIFIPQKITITKIKNIIQKELNNNQNIKIEVIVNNFNLIKI